LEPDKARPSSTCAWDGLDALRTDLRRSLKRFGVCRSELDDVVQDALLRAARYRHRLTDDERLRPWVTRIAVNVLRDRMRHGMRLPVIEAPDEVFALMEGREAIPGDGPPDDWLESNGEVYERARLLRHLGRALDELPPSDRRVLERWYACPDDESPASRVCETSPQLAKVHVFRARSRLVRLLRKRLALLARTGAPEELPRVPVTSKERRGARCAAVHTSTKKRRGAKNAVANET
jgi:RNA polymerase sigma factor (sigma-70 family)